jgi:hypothetical protein
VSDEAWNQLTELAIVAGMNERYWGEIECGLFIRFTVSCVLIAMAGVFAVIGLTWRKNGHLLPLVFAIFFAVASTCLMLTYPAPGIGPAGDLRDQWSQLKVRTDNAIKDKQPELYRELLAAKERLNADEPPYADEALLLQCLAAEEKSRGVK